MPEEKKQNEEFPRTVSQAKQIRNENTEKSDKKPKDK